MEKDTNTPALLERVKEVLDNGVEEEKGIIELALQAIQRKKEKNSAYISGFMGLSGEFLDEDTYQFVVPITPFLMNRINMVHGGITATLADSTMGSLVTKKLPPGYHAVTSEMKINYIAPGKGEKLISTAKALHMGKQLCVTECKITNEKGKLIVAATGTFFVIKERKNMVAAVCITAIFIYFFFKSRTIRKEQREEWKSLGQEIEINEVQGKVASVFQHKKRLYHQYWYTELELIIYTSDLQRIKVIWKKPNTEDLVVPAVQKNSYVCLKGNQRLDTFYANQLDIIKAPSSTY